MDFTPKNAPTRTFTPSNTGNARLQESQSALANSQSIIDDVLKIPSQNKSVDIAKPFTDGLHTIDPTGQQSKSFIQDALPTAGAIGGAIGGGVLGAPLGPAGVYAGGVAGASAGSALGDVAKQAISGSSVDLKQAGKTGAEYGALEAVGGPLISGIGKIIKPVGKWLAKAVIPKSDVEAGVIQSYKAANPIFERLKSALSGSPIPRAPQTAAQTAFDKGLLGTESMIGIQAKREGQNLWNNLIGPKLKESKTEVDMPAFFSDVEKQIVKDNPEPGRQKDLLEALQAMKDDYAGIPKAKAEDIQRFKEGWATFVPEKAYKGKPIASAYRDVQNIAAGKARDFLYKELGPEGRKAYIDYGNLIAIQALGRKAITDGAVPIGGTGTVINSILNRAAIPVGTTGGQTIYKVGEGIEMVGKPGGRTIRDVVGTLLGVGSDPSEGTYSSE